MRDIAVLFARRFLLHCKNFRETYYLRSLLQVALLFQDVGLRMLAAECRPKRAFEQGRPSNARK
jgi:hypothetical protein